MSCRNCIHRSVCYLVESHGLTEMSFNVNKFGCFDYVDKDVLNNEKCENCTYTTVVIHAEWFKSNYDFICTNCGIHSKGYHNFCPNCGAKMDKE